MRHQLSEHDPLRGAASEIQGAAERAGVLIRQLMLFSRRQIVQPKVVSLNDIIEKIRGMLRRLVGEDIEFVYDLEPQLAPICADSGQLEQMIINLAVNARDAMPKGGRITIESRNKSAQAAAALAQVAGPLSVGSIVLSVSDNGTGMDSETLSHIFEPFFTTKEPGRGTGLGLATVHGIVTQAGGQIRVYSEVGRGTTFEIELPRTEQTASDSAVGNLAASAPTGVETILLVEDEDQVRKLIRSILERLGYRVLEASQPREALLIGAGYEGPIHLLLTDIVMPEVGGHDLAERLTASRPEMRVLFISGYSNDIIRQRNPLTRGRAILHKPFSSLALALSVRESIDQRQTSDV
jgi:CheY-like chemotaxis protein